MLDTETKRRIDTCRDILVGKVPDPKSQVEQITIALIYKFMDDMDLEAEELGGERRFFTKDYERYRWAKLMAPGVSGQDMLNTYSEALQKMVENESLPKLFRDIFRNAYLPYRDPETLRAFLREINIFNYDHSEKLGDAFEYLLSVLGSQGDAGQFRTPRHIIDFMVEIIDPQKNEVIMDPACGTAGFLISAYKHILKQNSTGVVNSNSSIVEVDAAEQALESPMRYPGDLLKPEDRMRLARNLKGYDISPDMVRLSLVNLYLHGFADPKVEEYDTLTSEDKWTEMADVILANPPFMSPKGGIKPHTKFQVQSKRSEVLFVDYIAEHLTPNGRAAIVVPEGIIFQSQTAYRDLRKMLVKNHLAAVISLPAGVFNPYSGVKTSILILDRAVAKASDHVAFFKIENDGFALGAQRKAVKGSQLARVKAELGAWLQASRVGGCEGLESSLGFAVSRDEVAKGDYVLSGERYKEAEAKASRWPLVPIGDLCDLINGRAFKPEDWEDAEGGGLPIIRIQNLNNPSAALNYFSGEVRDRFIVETGDLLFSWSGSRGTSFGAHLWNGTRAILNQHIFNVKFDETRADKMYLLRILNAVVDQVEDNLHGGVGLVHITKGNLEKIEIPLPPLEVQREIVAEVEGYQRVIDGARAVLDNYKPLFSINAGWSVVALKAVVGFQEGPGILAKDFVSSGVPLVRLSGVQAEHVTLDGCNYLDPDLVATKWPHFRMNLGDILISTSASFGKVSVVTKEAEGAICYTGIIRFWPTSSELHHGYLRVFLGSENFLAQAASFTSGAVIKHFGPTHLKQMSIPLPPLGVQMQIASDIEAEQAIIKGNRDLIARFEKKIDAAISRVWGEAKGSD